MTQIKPELIKTENIDHLGLIAATLKSCGLIEKINNRLPISKNKGAKVSMGLRAAAMILNGLGFLNDRLYLQQKFLENKPAELLLGAGVCAEHFNDDALGRLLDAIADYGITPFFSEIALEIATEQGLLGHSVHMDTTTFSVQGAYVGDPVTDEEGAILFEVTKGYSKDKRPDLKQVVLNLATTGAASFPIWLESHSGNASDKIVLQEGAARMNQFCSQLKGGPDFLYVGDSAFYERCVSEQVAFKWLTRVPERIKVAKSFITQPAQVYSWIELGEGYQMTPLQTEGYGSVKQRWFLIQSEKAAARELKTLERKIKAEYEEYETTLWHLGNKTFECDKDAESSFKTEIKKLNYHQASLELIPVEKHEGQGRPKTGAVASIVGYKIKATLRKHDEAIAKCRMEKGRFILATNELDKGKLPDAGILSEYKEQYKIEQSFKFIKSDVFLVDSIFLKKQSRIAALLAIMGLCLMMYGLAQNRVRQALKEAKASIPNQAGKPTQTPTMAWVARIFEGIHRVHLSVSGVTYAAISNISPVREQIIRYFGPEAMRIYERTG